MNYLLDTNICIALINGTSNKVRARFMQATYSKANLSTSSIVAHELWYGVAKSQQIERNANALAVFLSRDVCYSITLSRILMPPERFAPNSNARACALASATR